MPEDTPELHPVVRRFIEDAGNTTQSLGVGRVLGQIYACLYFSDKPRNLNDLQSLLGISKGSASMCVRQLEQWNAVRRVWIRGDRKDYYVASDWFGQILKNAVIDTIGKRITTYADVLDEMEDEVKHAERPGDLEAFIRDRIRHLRRFHKRAQGLWNSPLLKSILK